jgi:hypothetical protein
VILVDCLPLCNLFFATANAFSPTHLAHLTRFLLAAITDGPRLSAARAAGTIRTDPRHRGNLLRFLQRLPAGLVDDFLEATFGNLLTDAPAGGTWIFAIDQTYCGHNSTRMENTYSTSPRGQRHSTTRKNKRNKHKKQPHRYCHCFVFGLLLTPNGLRLPVFTSYLTKEYCAATKQRYYKQTELAAGLIDQLRVPATAEVVVVGDAAFDAAPILAACKRRNFGFIVTMNHDRVTAGASREERTKLTAAAADLTAQDYRLVRLTPGQGPFVEHRRAAACRLGSNKNKRQSRRFWVHRRAVDVHNVGRCVAVYSTTRKPVAGQAVVVQKVLLSSEVARSVAQIVEIYDLRWQIELFFREMKSTLGMARYQLGRFAAVASWVRLCCVAFVYLEWYRHEMVKQSAGNSVEVQRWRTQRAYGLSRAVQQDVEAAELALLAARLATADGVEQLREQLRRAVPKEYRKAA